MRITFLLSLTILAFVVSDACADDSAEKFWNDFRKAVVRHEYSKVVALTHFPFEILGLDESKPTEYHGKKGFRKNYMRVLFTPLVVQSSGDKLLHGDMLQVIQGKAKLTEKDYVSPEFIRVEQFVFERINGQWFFTRAYVDE